MSSLRAFNKLLQEQAAAAHDTKLQRVADKEPQTAAANVLRMMIRSGAADTKLQCAADKEHEQALSDTDDEVLGQKLFCCLGKSQLSSNDDFDSECDTPKLTYRCCSKAAAVVPDLDLLVDQPDLGDKAAPAVVPDLDLRIDQPDLDDKAAPSCEKEGAPTLDYMLPDDGEDDLSWFYGEFEFAAQAPQDPPLKKARLAPRPLILEEGAEPPKSYTLPKALGGGPFEPYYPPTLSTLIAHSLKLVEEAECQVDVVLAMACLTHHV